MQYGYGVGVHGTAARARYPPLLRILCRQIFTAVLLSENLSAGLYKDSKIIYYDTIKHTAPPVGRTGGFPRAEERMILMKRVVALLLIAALCLFGLTACAVDEAPVVAESLPQRELASEPESEPEPEPEPEPLPPPYDPEYLTGLPQGEDYDTNRRVTAVMINNIAQSRPQRGTAQADILFEIKVEGGITRFMGLFSDYSGIEGDVGPVRSGRDQFLRLAIPFDAQYMHIGRSGITQTYIDQNEYNDRDVDGQIYNFIYRDSSRSAMGYAYEHTAFTTAELLQEVFDSRDDVSMEHTYSGTCFDFNNYNEEGGGILPLSGDDVEDALEISVTHSYSYRTYFDYDETTGEYAMSQWSSSRGCRHETVDENTGEQLEFENVFILFADIYPYYYPGGNLDANGNDKGDPDYQCVDMDYGCVGYYFSNGQMKPIRWFKGATTDMLRLTDMDENSLKVNCGKSYIAFVDLDEYENFSYSAGEMEEEVIEQTDDVGEIGD